MLTLLLTTFSYFPEVHFYIFSYATQPRRSCILTIRYRITLPTLKSKDTVRSFSFFTHSLVPHKNRIKDMGNRKKETKMCFERKVGYSHTYQKQNMWRSKFFFVFSKGNVIHFTSLFLFCWACYFQETSPNNNFMTI